MKLRVAKGQPAPSVAQVSVNKNSPPASDCDHAPQHTAQQPFLSSNVVVEMSGADMVDEISPREYEGNYSFYSFEILQVFVVAISQNMNLSWNFRKAHVGFSFEAKHA